MEKIMTEQQLITYIIDNMVYNEDGTISRLDYPNSNGYHDKDGYIITKVRGKACRVHRIVWLLNHGCFPDGEIDHINGIRDDNRIENLRETTRKGNNATRRAKINKDTGVAGIYIDKRTKGLKKIYCFNFRYKVHRYKTLDEAIIARDRMRNEYYGDCLVQ